MTRKHRNEQRNPRSLRISEEKIRCSVLLHKVVVSVLPFVFVCRLFKGAENVQNNITVQILCFHLAVYNDVSCHSCNRCVVSVSEVTSPLFPSWKHMPPFEVTNDRCQHTLSLGTVRDVVGFWASQALSLFLQ